MKTSKRVPIKSHLTPDDKRELLEAINKAREVIDDNIEGGSTLCSTAHDAQHKVNVIARKLGFKQENYWGNFTL